MPRLAERSFVPATSPFASAAIAPAFSTPAAVSTIASTGFPVPSAARRTSSGPEVIGTIT